MPTSCETSLFFLPKFSRCRFDDDEDENAQRFSSSSPKASSRGFNQMQEEGSSISESSFFPSFFFCALVLLLEKLSSLINRAAATDAFNTFEHTSVSNHKRIEFLFSWRIFCFTVLFLLFLVVAMVSSIASP